MEEVEIKNKARRKSDMEKMADNVLMHQMSWRMLIKNTCMRRSLSNLSACIISTAHICHP